MKLGEFEQAMETIAPTRYAEGWDNVGLLAEEYDPHAKRQLGNFPQAYSHIGLINAAHNLVSRSGPAEQRAAHVAPRSAEKVIEPRRGVT